MIFYQYSTLCHRITNIDFPEYLANEHFYFSYNLAIWVPFSELWVSSFAGVLTIIWNSCADRSNHENVISESVSDKICHSIMDWKFFLANSHRQKWEMLWMFWKLENFKFNLKVSFNLLIRGCFQDAETKIAEFIDLLLSSLILFSFCHSPIIRRY